MKRILITCLLVAFSLCTSFGAPAKKKAVIGVSLLTMANPFFRELGDAMRDEAKKHDMEVILNAGEYDPAKQHHQVSDFITRRVDAIVLSPCDSKSIGTAIAEANKAGIPVFTVDIAALSQGAKVVSHVATDNLGGGKMAAEAMMEALPNGGSIAIMDHPEVESVILRVRGFESQLAADPRGSKIKIVAKLPGGGEKEKSFRATEDVLQAHPEIKGIFASNDPAALGVVAALEKAGKLGQVKVVGFDGMPEGKQAIKAGKIYADPIQFPDRLGRESVQGILKYLAGDDVRPTVLIPTALYRKKDAEADRTLK